MSQQVRRLHKTRYEPFAAHVVEGRPTVEHREEFCVINPANGEDLCTVAAATASDVDLTINHAHAVFTSGTWSRATPLHRSQVLTKLARALETRVPEFAEIEMKQTGRAIREMRAQLGRLGEWLDYYAALLRTQESFVAPTQGQLLNYVQRVPLGVVAQITPFNHPLLIAIKKIAPALAAGNSVVVKPSELAPISVLEFAEMAVEAGVPLGVLSVLPGYGPTTGAEIVSHPLVRKVDITAGTTTGRAIGSVVGRNLAAYTAELGGKAPIVIFDNADVPSAINGAAFACFVASGQTCVSGTRVIVQSGVYEEFMKGFLMKVESIRRRMGDPSNPSSTMGTVISPLHLSRIHKMVSSRSSSTKLLAGGEPMTGASDLDGFEFSRGCFYPPTVLENVGTEDELWKEEVFGPVVVVKKFETEAEGVRLANDSKYGLGAGIWTTDLSRAHRVSGMLESGLVWVNTHHRNDPSSPWGGMKESGIGRENGVEALHAYSQSKSTIVNIAPPEESRVKDDWFAESAEGKRYG
ncbi:aldehyde dehydrogenase [Stereum hirsutum FP-91666 SS1]|uniref:aldehyde dehydrogenase n=1 Tax=Stereum hirsutum (strain FP-91666) TaxID=721885 RepID=UPI000440B477|nr:aldehyde dehydrogenase [Stereum hirsutum FP-91666 SS1]EIM87936.1 aldehyde dehydrogenase [Stereum hirsutum FP-91666 SS1]